LDRSLETCAKEIAQAGLEVDVDLGALRERRAWVAPRDFHFIVCNLVSNAARAMEDSTAKRLAIRAVQEGGFIRVSFTDTGRGIPQKDWECIFDYGVTTKRGQGGAGLYRAREALKQLGGSIAVSWSEPGIGSTVVMTLRTGSASR
jgi:signal transduction histidine kinase